MGEHLLSSRALPHSAKAIPLTNANLTLDSRALQLVSASESGPRVKRFDGSEVGQEFRTYIDCLLKLGLHCEIVHCEYFSCSVLWIYAMKMYSTVYNKKGNILKKKIS